MTDPATNPASPRLLADLGFFWPMVRLSLGLSLVGVMLLGTIRWDAALAFGIPAMWVTFFFALLGLIAAAIGPGGLTGRRRGIVVGAMIGKLLLLALATILVARTAPLVWREGLAWFVLGGAHVFPAVLLLRWCLTRYVQRSMSAAGLASLKSPGAKS